MNLLVFGKGSDEIDRVVSFHPGRSSTTSRTFPLIVPSSCVRRMHWRSPTWPTGLRGVPGQEGVVGGVGDERHRVVRRARQVQVLFDPKRAQGARRRGDAGT